jgi:NADPH:quinone reductase-like Zn-dependent oxidoreductase
MWKVVIHRPGGHDRLRLEAGRTPVPGPGEALVEAEAIGVNYADCVVRMGLYASALEYVGWPITPGFELAGRLVALGPATGETSRVAVGERVIAVTRFGAYATQAVVPCGQLFPIPAGIACDEAAAFPAVHLTAYYALHVAAHVHAGDRVLVHSAAGGVGGALCQLAARAGASVVGIVGSGHKVAVARALGAGLVIDKSAGDWRLAARAAAPAGFDLVLDANGVSTLGASYDLLRPSGSLVVYGFHSMLPRRGGRPNLLRLAWDYLRTPRFNPLEMTQHNRGVCAFNLSYLFDRGELLRRAMTELLAWRSAGELRAPTLTRYPFEQVALAHRDLESGRTTGKLVLIP